MPRNTSVILGEYYTQFVSSKIKAGRFQSASEAVRAGLHLLEEQEIKLDLLREKLAPGEAQSDRSEGVGGTTFMREPIE